MKKDAVSFRGRIFFGYKEHAVHLRSCHQRGIIVGIINRNVTTRLAYLGQDYRGDPVSMGIRAKKALCPSSPQMQ